MKHSWAVGEINRPKDGSGLADAVHQYDVPFLCSSSRRRVRESENARLPQRLQFQGQQWGAAGKRLRDVSRSVCGEVIDDFVQAARRAKQAGLDGIELHGCHSYLICQFF